MPAEFENCGNHDVTLTGPNKNKKKINNVSYKITISHKIDISAQS